MTGYKTLVLATDFSDAASKAAVHASSIASVYKANVHVLHVITELADSRNRRLPLDLRQQFIREVEVHAMEDMHQFVGQHFSDAEQAGYQVDTTVISGACHDEILKLAKTVNADLIVMGTHGRTGLEKILVGSTAEKVVRSSSIPVLTVRQ